MWEIPNEAALREKERYLADVNYIPPSQNATTNDRSGSREQTPETDNNNIIDDTMADYLFSAFDRRREEEEAESNNNMDNNNNNNSNDIDEDYDEPISSLSKSREDTEPPSYAYGEELSLDTTEVDKLLLDMGIGSTT
jgi:hypothetical protein